MFERIRTSLNDSYAHDEARKTLVFRLLNIVLGGIALVMTIVNISTSEIMLMILTASYSLLCAANFFFVRWRKRVVSFLFCVETTALLGVFLVTGNPEGFSALWTLVVPSCALAVFGKKNGSVFSAATFLMIVFFFWLPWGRELLRYEYSSTFMLRFPFVYVCLYCISFYVENIKLNTLMQLKETENHLRYLYNHDALTGLHNRYAFREEMDKIVQNSVGRVAVIVMDVDDFKLINDRYGHDSGDEALRALTGIIQKHTCEHCVAGRWGGEEFLILLHCAHDPYEIAEKIRKEVEESSFAIDGNLISLTVSVGVSTGSDHSLAHIQSCIHEADKAMYLSKQKGKNRTTVYGSEVK